MNDHESRKNILRDIMTLFTDFEDALMIRTYGCDYDLGGPEAVARRISTIQCFLIGNH